MADGRASPGISLPLGTLRLPALRAGDGFARKVGAMLSDLPSAGECDAMYMIGGTWFGIVTIVPSTCVVPGNFLPLC